MPRDAESGDPLFFHVYRESARALCSVDDEKQSDPFAVIPAAAFDKGYVIVKKGKKIFHKIQKA